MEREEHLNFCRKCTNRKFDRNQGIVCGLTMKIADFEESCPDFNEDVEVKSPPSTYHVRPSHYLRFSVFTLFVGFLPFTIIAIVYGIRVEWKYATEDFHGAKKDSIYARNWAIASFIIALVCIALYIWLDW